MLKQTLLSQKNFFEIVEYFLNHYPVQANNQLFKVKTELFRWGSSRAGYPLAGHLALIYPTMCPPDFFTPVLIQEGGVDPRTVGYFAYPPAKPVSALEQVELLNAIRIMTILGYNTHLLSYGGCSWEIIPPNIQIYYQIKDEPILGTLRHYYKKALTESQKVCVARQIAQALRYIHEPSRTKPSVIHNFLNLDTVLLTSSNVKLSFFNYSRVVHPDLPPESRKVLNLPLTLFIAPELFKENAPCSIKSDIYSFGVILWYLFNEMDFKAPLDLSLTIIKNKQPLPIGLEHPLNDLISSCFRANPSSRPSIAKIIEELDKLPCDKELKLSSLSPAQTDYFNVSWPKPTTVPSRSDFTPCNGATAKISQIVLGPKVVVQKQFLMNVCPEDCLKEIHLTKYLYFLNKKDDFDPVKISDRFPNYAGHYFEPSGQPGHVSLFMGAFSDNFYSILTDKSARFRPDDPKYPLEILKILLDTAKALYVLHSLEPPILHRDVKPQNVFVRKSSQKGRSIYVVLGDLGTAASLDKMLTDKVGTPKYQAPEISTLEGYGLPADVYSFGKMIADVTLIGVAVKPAPDEELNPDSVAFERAIKHHKVGKKLFRLYQECTLTVPGDRPPILEVICQLQSANKTLAKNFII